MSDVLFTGWITLTERGGYTIIASKPDMDASDIATAYAPFVAPSEGESLQRSGRVKQASSIPVAVHDNGHVVAVANADLFFTAAEIYRDAGMELPSFFDAAGKAFKI